MQTPPAHTPSHLRMLQGKTIPLAYARIHSYEKAVKDFTKSIEINPDEYMAYFNRGNAYYELNMINEAINDYKHYIEKAPQYSKQNYEVIQPVSHLYLDQLSAYFAQLNNYEEAINCEERAIKIAIDRKDLRYLDSYKRRLSCYKNNQLCE